jgi:hypothetical protein
VYKVQARFPKTASVRSLADVHGCRTRCQKYFVFYLVTLVTKGFYVVWYLYFILFYEISGFRGGEGVSVCPWVVTSCVLTGGYTRFGATYCFHLQG